MVDGDYRTFPRPTRLHTSGSILDPIAGPVSLEHDGFKSRRNQDVGIDLDFGFYDVIGLAFGLALLVIPARAFGEMFTARRKPPRDRPPRRRH